MFFFAAIWEKRMATLKKEEKFYETRNGKARFDLRL